MFDWDDGNIDKNITHAVHDWEIEEACQDPYSKIVAHQFAKAEKRYILLGRAATSGKYLRVVYTLRKNWTGELLIRPISAVEMSDSQRRQYKKK